MQAWVDARRAEALAAVQAESEGRRAAAASVAATAAPATAAAFFFSPSPAGPEAAPSHRLKGGSGKGRCQASSLG